MNNGRIIFDTKRGGRKITFDFSRLSVESRFFISNLDIKMVEICVVYKFVQFWFIFSCKNLEKCGISCIFAI